MKLYSLVRGSEVIGYRVIVPELSRAYDINTNLFKSYAEGSISLVNLDSIFMHEGADGKWYSDDEEKHGEGIKTYLEEVYDTEVANLVVLLSSKKPIVFGKTEVVYNNLTYKIADVDCGMGTVIIEREGKNFGTSDCIPLMQAVRLVNTSK